MAHLVGLAFTSPVAVSPGIPEPFSVHVFVNAAALNDFVIAKKATRKLIVFVTSVRDLENVLTHKDYKSLTGVVVFDDIFALQELEGVPVLDAQTSDSEGWKSLSIRVTSVLEIMEKPSSPEPPKLAIPRTNAILAKLAAPANFRDLVRRVVQNLPPTTRDAAIVESANLLVRLQDKSAWVEQVAVPYRAANTSPEALIEFERYVDGAPASQALWHAFYAVSEGLSDAPTAATLYEADVEDLTYLLQVIPPVGGRKYLQTPPKIKEIKKVAKPRGRRKTASA